MTRQKDEQKKQNIHIDREKCTGCGLCVQACPFGAVSLQERKALIDYENCTLCGACASICPAEGAIVWEASSSSAGEQHTQGDIWVYAEHTVESGLVPVTLELLGKARELADTLDATVQGIVLGPYAQGVPEQLITHGADKVTCVSDPDLSEFHDETHANALARLVNAGEPNILLGGATAVGRALMPRLAVLLHAGLTADCTALSVEAETGLLRQTRPAFGGNILATITCEQHRPQMATVRPGVFPKSVPDAERTGRIIHKEAVGADLRRNTQLISFAPTEGGANTLQEADIIVAAGYGVGGPEGVKKIHRLSKALGGSMAASRAVVDAGWVSCSYQVGQTGTTVQPELYIACGISGAIQHAVGMQNAGTVVAINRDPEAPIHEIADYCLVGDLHEIVEALIGEIEQFPSQSQPQY